MQGTRYQLLKLSCCVSAGAIRRKIPLSSEQTSVGLTIDMRCASASYCCSSEVGILDVCMRFLVCG